MTAAISEQVASVALIGAMDLACAMRDGEPPETVRAAAQRVLDSVAGDPVAALCIAASLVRTDLPVDRWWDRGLEGLGSRRAELAPCGTRTAAVRHRDRGEDLDPACKQAERDFNRERMRATRARKRANAA